MRSFERIIVSLNFLSKSGGKEFKELNITKNVNLNKYVNPNFNLSVFIFHHIFMHHSVLHESYDI